MSLTDAWMTGPLSGPAGRRDRARSPAFGLEAHAPAARPGGSGLRARRLFLARICLRLVRLGVGDADALALALQVGHEIAGDPDLADRFALLRQIPLDRLLRCRTQASVRASGEAAEA